MRDSEKTMAADIRKAYLGVDSRAIKQRNKVAAGLVTGNLEGFCSEMPRSTNSGVPQRLVGLLRANLPYMLHPFGGDKYERCFIAVNREYKPLGYLSDRMVNYEDYPSHHLYIPSEVSDVIRATVPKIDVHDDDCIAFFYDGNPPWHSRGMFNAYKARLQGVMQAINFEVQV